MSESGPHIVVVGNEKGGCGKSTTTMHVVTAMSESGPHIVVVGNEKGGCGKSTTTMHVVTGLLKAGLAVGSIDLDGRQRTLTRYVEDRHAWSEARALNT